MKKEEVLWISIAAPYDKVQHAGGQIHNFYLKYLNATDVELFLLSRCKMNEVEKLDLDKYNVSNDIIIPNQLFIKKIYRKLSGFISDYNPYDEYAALLYKYQKKEYINKLKKIKREMEPEVIILQWTSIVLLLPIIKEMFPKAKVISIEEDVSYLGYQRKYEKEQNIFYKWVLKNQYKKLKKFELEVLGNSEIVIVNNPKDKRLLISDGVNVNKIFEWCPYFNNLNTINRNPIPGNIIFYGAMWRKENYLSVIWFINEVFNKMNNSNLCLFIIGGNPHKSLYRYQKSNVKILGYVERIEEYFEKAMCLVAPLVLGAGVKIKILESLSAGVPILTNSIGIEGIDAVHGEEYFHCEQPKDYINIINNLLEEKYDVKGMMKKERNFICKHYNFDNSANNFYKIIRTQLDME